MSSTNYIQKIVIKRFSEKHQQDDATQKLILAPEGRHPKQLKRFLRMAELRKRQILEKMLMD